MSLVWIAQTQFVKSSNPSQVVDVADKDAPQRWAKEVDENLRTLGIRNWRQAAIVRDVWRRKLAEAKICNRL